VAYLNPAIKLLFNKGFAFLKALIPSSIPLPGLTCSTYADTAIGASITSKTLFTTGSKGIFKITYYAVVTRAATTSSSVTAAFGFTDDSGAQTTAATASPTNTLGNFVQGDITVELAAGADLTFATTYASSGATSMQHSLYIAVQRLA